MPLSILFWVVYLLSLFVGYWGYYEPNTPWFKHAGHGFTVWLLVGILGWSVFGPAVK